MGCFTAVTGLAQVRITEFMASNSHTLADDFGNYEDWIEIQNTSPTNVNLLDWSLTDNASSLTKWRFPATDLPAGNFLVVFASNKNRRTVGAPFHTNFKLSAASGYLALVKPDGLTKATEFAPSYPPQVADVSYGFALTASNVTLVATGAVARVLVPSAANGGAALNYSWTGAAANEPFDTAAWTSGATGVGFGVTPGDLGLNVQTPMLHSNASAFVRLPFVLSNPTNFSQLTLRLKYDDGFVAWINGVEVARANAPAQDLAANSTATATHAATDFESITFGLADNLLRTGTNILAIQGMNVGTNDGTFLMLPELSGVTIAGDNNGLYFTSPTPGAENLGGTTAPGPGLVTAQHTPNVPLDNDDLIVTAKVFATARAVSNVTLHYRVMFAAETAVTMFDDGAHGDGTAGDGIYGATIPASASINGQMVRYYITAADVSNTVSRLPLFTDPAATAEYYGTVVNPYYVTSAVPVVHLFAPASVLQPGTGPGGGTSQTGADSETGSRVSLFANGEFYDNISMSLRGNSTAGYYKKSHRVEFNKEHPFLYGDSNQRIRKTSFEANYPDPTHMRQGLSFWLNDQLGVPAPFIIPTRLQLNGNFYQLTDQSDVQGEEMLSRFGYDPNGAYYANVGTVVPSRFSTGGFEKKTRKAPVGTAEDYSDYTALTTAIAESLTTGQRMTNLLDRLDLPEVINYLVVARFTHQNDDVWANMALYHDNDGDDLWRVLPYDQNLSWGAAYMDSASYSGIQSTNDTLKSFPLYGSSQALPVGSGNWNRMYDVIFSVPATREMFLRRLRTVLDAWVKPPGTLATNLPIEQKALAWRNLIAEEVQHDRAWWGWPAKGGQGNFDPGINITNGVDDIINVFMAPRRQHFYGKHSVTNTALTIGINKTNNAGIPLAQPTNAALAIVAWDYNPVSANQDEEYVQLTNANNFAVDISGWELAGGVQFQFQPGTVVPAKSAVYVSPNVRAFRARTASPHGGQGLFIVGPYSGHLNAWGESLTLSDTTGSLVSSNGFAGTPSPAQRFLRITEIMYNPAAAPAITNDAQQFEYVELKNISTNTTLDLTGVRITNGISFNFTGSAMTSLAPGQTVLVVHNAAAFVALYGNSATIAGQFIGSLSNGGDTIRLEDAFGEKILEFAYKDSWYPLTDGLGFSLVIVNENAAWDTWDQKASWRASGALHGSPGVTDPLPPAFSPILVNEVLTHTDLPQLDSVELYNPNTNAVNLGGWWLTDDFYTPKKYRLPNGTTIPAGSYLVITETQFNTGTNAFRFSELGESVYLFAADTSSNLTGYYHGYDFPAAPNGVSFGRYTNSLGEVQFVLQSAITLGTNNAYPRVGPIVITEIMYHPPDTNGADNTLDEFIELQNITATNVALYDPAYPTNAWHVDNGVTFAFPTNQTLAAGARLLIVGFDPANAAQLATFRAKYGVSNSVAVFGPWNGKLNNASDIIELKQPGTPEDLTDFVPYYLIDNVSYTDSAPWPRAADGLGNSLHRVALTAFGNDPTNWFASGPSAGRASIPNILPTVAITSPTNGALLVPTNGTIIAVSANDSDGSLALVQLLVDGGEIARWTSISSNFLWLGAAAGTHVLKARATDNVGAITETPAVTVTVTVPPPVVMLIAPTNNAVFLTGASVLLSANATSGGAPAAVVYYYLDGSLLGSVGSPFTLPWTANPPGYHTLSAVAGDATGLLSAPAAVSIFVQATTANPVVIPAGSVWRYLDNNSNQGTNWINPAFADNTWSNGLAKLGFNNGNVGIATLLSYGTNSKVKYITYYFRQQFVVPALTGMTNLYLEVQRDDGVALYLNGTNFYRDNLPSGTLTYSQLATNCSDDGFTWQTATLPLTSLLPGTNIIAAEVHQSAITSSDIAFDLRLTLLGTLTGPAITTQPQSLARTNGLAASFAITAIGSGPLAYQWRHSGTNLTGATTNFLNLPAVADASAGDYQVIVTNAAGSVTSLVATLTIHTLDTDGDGMPDAWEIANGTNPNVNDAGSDPDHDGMSNWQEYLAGTSPTNAASVFKMTALPLSGTNLVFNFTAMSNHSYTVQFQPQLGVGAWLKWLDIPAAPSNRTLWLTNGVAGTTNCYFRLATPAQP